MMFSDFLKTRVTIGSKIAVVGSSPRILDAPRGHVIDEHDDVIRFNFAMTDGREEYTGSKTTIRVVGQTLKEHHEEHFRKIAPRENAVIVTKEQNVELLSRVYPADKIILFRNYVKATKTALNRLGERGFDHPPQQRPPRTGLVVISALLGEVEAKGGVINLIGFDDKAPTNEPWRNHYFSNKTRVGAFDALQERHCDPTVEAQAIRFLAELPHVNLR